MNKPIEKLLKQMSLVSPSEDLDRRVEEALDPAKPTTSKPLPSRIDPSWWTVCTAAVACSAIGLLCGLALGKQGMIVEQRRSHSALQQPVNHTEAISPEENPIVLYDHGLYLLNGKNPVRRYGASRRDIGRSDAHQQQIDKTVVLPSFGT